MLKRMRGWRNSREHGKELGESKRNYTFLRSLYYHLR